MNETLMPAPAHIDQVLNLVGLLVCATGAAAILTVLWWGILRLAWIALRDQTVMAAFVRWVMIRHIRKTRREAGKILDAVLSHTQKAPGGPK